MSISLAAKPGE